MFRQNQELNQEILRQAENLIATINTGLVNNFAQLNNPAINQLRFTTTSREFLVGLASIACTSDFEKQAEVVSAIMDLQGMLDNCKPIIDQTILNFRDTVVAVIRNLDRSAVEHLPAAPKKEEDELEAALRLSLEKSEEELLAAALKLSLETDTLQPGNRLIDEENYDQKLIAADIVASLSKEEIARLQKQDEDEVKLAMAMSLFANINVSSLQPEVQQQLPVAAVPVLAPAVEVVEQPQVVAQNQEIPVVFFRREDNARLVIEREERELRKVLAQNKLKFV